MMYSNKLAVAIKSAGKVLREFNKDEVYLPFGKEYSIFIKNMNSHRALVKVTIDGTDVGDGTRFVVGANDTFDLERFIKNGNFSEGNRLKFIERTENISDHRGVGIEDGLIQVEFNFEKPQVRRYVRDNGWHPQVWNDPFVIPPVIYGSAAGSAGDPKKGLMRGVSQDSIGGHMGEPCSDTVNVNYSADVSCNAAGSLQSTTFTTTDMAGGFIDLVNQEMDAVDAEIGVDNDAGITVPGSKSDQSFRTVRSFPTEATTHTIVLKLLGETEDNQPVRKAVTVKAKPKCVTCGRVNKATNKFCAECGTSLNIV